MDANEKEEEHPLFASSITMENSAFAALAHLSSEESDETQISGPVRARPGRKKGKGRKSPYEREVKELEFLMANTFASTRHKK
jgi:hypothetical protein